LELWVNPHHRKSNPILTAIFYLTLDTLFPPMMTSSTLISLILSGGTVIGFSARMVKSAGFPSSIDRQY
jgi:hypothetical protein